MQKTSCESYIISHYASLEIYGAIRSCSSRASDGYNTYIPADRDHTLSGLCLLYP